MTNRCPICAGFGRVLALGACRDPIAVPCPECAGLSITPASADDVRRYTVGEITEMLLRHPALPSAGAPAENAVDAPPLRTASADPPPAACAVGD